MSRDRDEFPKSVRKAAWKRSGGLCEGILATGTRCSCDLERTRFAYDHVNPDGLTGKPTLENCQLLCDPCHKEKTRQDVKNIAQAKRREDARRDIRRPVTMQSAPFPKYAEQRSATKALAKPSLPRRSLFVSNTERSQ